MTNPGRVPGFVIEYPGAEGPDAQVTDALSIPLRSSGDTVTIAADEAFGASQL